MFISFIGFSQQSKTEIYISKYKDLAVSEMKEYGIPASITLAQGILESGNGESRLAKEGRNHFGIKCHSNWDGETIYADDDQTQECFRKYKKVSESYRDHSLFLSARSRYIKLFDLKLTDYKGWARGLKESGYATDKTYDKKLISLIERYQLYQYDIINNENQTKKLDDRLFSFSRTYGFPFFFGIGMNYVLPDDSYFLYADIQSSLIYSNLAFGVNKHLYKDLYWGVNTSIMYHSFNESKNETSFLFGPEITYNFSLKENSRSLLVKLGVIYTFDEFQDYQYFPRIEITYLMR